MSKKCKRGASCAATGEAPSPLMRVVADLYERIDFQKDTIDGLRGERRQLVDGVDDLNAALNAALDERDAALARVDMLARSGHSWAVGCEKAETALARVQDAANRAFVIASTGVGSIQDIATALAPVIPEGAPLAEPKPATLGEVAETIRGFIDELKTRGPILGVDLPESVTATDQVVFTLPPGFISIDPADLPARLAEKIEAQHAAGAPFVEVDAADLPRDVFRRIFGLDRQPEPEQAPVQPERTFTEAESFMIEAALHHGFDPADDECSRYTATGDAIVKLVTAAREQGQRDVLALAEETAGCTTSLPLPEAFRYAVAEIRKRATYKALGL